MRPKKQWETRSCSAFSVLLKSLDCILIIMETYWQVLSRRVTWSDLTGKDCSCRHVENELQRRKSGGRETSEEAISASFLISCSILQLFSSWPILHPFFLALLSTLRPYDKVGFFFLTLGILPRTWFCSTLWLQPVRASESPSAWSSVDPGPLSHNDPHSWEAGDLSGAWRRLNLSYTIVSRTESSPTHPTPRGRKWWVSHQLKNNQN